MNEGTENESSRGEPGSGPTWEEPKPQAEPDTARSDREEPPPANDIPPADTPEGTQGASDGQPIVRNLKSKATWLRLVFIVFFAILYGITEIVLTATVVIQFLWTLLTGAPNEKLLRLGQSLARYVYQIIRYLTYNSDERPFPIDLDWPSGRAEEA